ncbi:MAG: hypothetical protein IKN55_06275, partial [Oscillospiraceae bacterium]|nr:hypothetical protein [Oscillospiraceae bacterium]
PPAEDNFTGLAGFGNIPADVIRPAAPAVTVLKKPEPIREPEPEPAALVPEEPEALDDDLFAAPEAPKPSGLFEDVRISLAAPVQPPEAETMSRPDAEQVEDNDFTAPRPAEAPSFQSWAGQAETNIEFYDAEELEALLPAEPGYCPVLGDPDGQTHDPAWIAACEQLCPASEKERIAALDEYIKAKEAVYDGPKVILMNKSWTTSEILEHPAVRQHLQQTAKLLWDETLKLCEGTEPPGWVVRVWMMRLVERAVDYFTINSN